jgi:opine dehydrogenase
MVDRLAAALVGQQDGRLAVGRLEQDVDAGRPRVLDPLMRATWSAVEASLALQRRGGPASAVAMRASLPRAAALVDRRIGFTGMRVAVLGAGNGGVASAFDFAQHGHDVALYSSARYDNNVVAVSEAGGITARGDLEGFVPIRYSGTDAGEAMDGAELVLVVGPAYSTEPLAALVAPHLDDGMAVLVCPGSCGGAIAFKRAAGLALDDARCILGETHTLPYAVRVTGPGAITVYLKLTTDVYLAGLPRAGTDRLYDLVKDVWPAVAKADSVMQTTLQNGNPVIHPAVTLLNTALLERTGGDFLFYEEGITKGVGRLIEAVDRERLAIATALGVTVLSEPAIGVRQGYMRQEDYSTGYSTAPGFLGIRAQSELDHRYLTEDVGYSLVFLSDLAARLDVPTPAMDAVITIASVVLARDFRSEGKRTLATLGLDGLSPSELAAL